MAAAQGIATGVDRRTNELRQRAPDSKSNGQLGQSQGQPEEKSKQRQVRWADLLVKKYLYAPLIRPEVNLVLFLQQTFLSILDEWEWLIAPILFTAAAFFTRMWKIGLSPIVTWDEAQ